MTNQFARKPYPSDVTDAQWAIRSAHPGIDDEQLRAVMPTARDDEQEVGP